MANNNIELITKYSTEAWDEVYKADARSALLDRTSNLVKFTGAKTVKIARIELTGMGNYYRPNDAADHPAGPGADGEYNFGYAGGNMGLIWDEYTIRYDRSQRIPVEMFDDEETMGLALGAATKELSRVIIVPEVDALCFSELASHTSEAKGNRAVTEIKTGDADANSVSLLNAAFLYFDTLEIPAEDQIVFASPKYMNALRNNKRELNRVLLQSDFGKNVSYTLTEYEGRQLAMVPPSRFKTDIVMGKRGYTWGAESKEINFMVVAKSAVTHVVKYNKVKVISGDLNLAGANFDGSTIFARIYHDVIVPTNKEYAIYAHVGNFDTDVKTPAAQVLVEIDETRKITRLEATGEGVMGVKYAYYTNESEIAVGATLPAAGSTLVKKGSVLAENAKVYAVHTLNGAVVAKTTVA